MSPYHFALKKSSYEAYLDGGIFVKELASLFNPSHAYLENEVLGEYKEGAGGETRATGENWNYSNLEGREKELEL